MATRERMQRFINSFGRKAEREAVMALFDRYGLSMLTDEQLEEAVSEQISDWRRRNRFNIAFRKRNAS